MTEVETPNVARMYNYFLGGDLHTHADRAAAAQAIAAVPETIAIVRENRRFLGRAVSFLAGDVGIDQFIDIGSGLPTEDNVHEIAQRLNPSARVVYADVDPYVVSRARELLLGTQNVRFAEADIRDPATVLGSPAVRELIDLGHPVAVLCVAMLQFTTEPAAIAAYLRDRVPSGSFLVISHPVPRTAQAGSISQIYAGLTFRTPEQVATLFDGWELVPPGIVALHEWRNPDEDWDPAGEWFCCGVARKP